MPAKKKPKKKPAGKKADRLQALVDQAEADDLYEHLDVTSEQVRIAELETELANVKAAHEALAEDMGKSDQEAVQIIAKLEAEIRRLRGALEEIRDLDIDLDPREFASQTGRIALAALASNEPLPKGWQREQVKEILRLFHEGKMGYVTQVDIDKIFENLDDEDPEVLKFVEFLADDAAAHPEKLGDMGELLKGVDELLDEP